MKKIFKGFKLSSFISSLIIGFFYPIIKTAISENKLLVFSDSCIIIGLIFVTFGIFNSLYLHGDFDITTYIASRVFHKDTRSFKAYEEDADDKRKDSFNYPLFTGIILVIISYIITPFI